jgi:type IV pilus assembly protein PilA
MTKKQKGFSLIELLIVVAIILIIAAIAIPNLLRAKMAANESSAVGSLRTVISANATYQSTYNHSFAGSLTILGGPNTPNPTCVQANLVDEVLGQDPANKSGYSFVYTPGGADPGDNGAGGAPVCGSVLTFGITSTPLQYNSTGTRSFFTDQTGVVRGKDNAGAVCDNTCPPL